MKKKIFLVGPRATRSTIKKKKRWGSGDENARAYDPTANQKIVGSGNEDEELVDVWPPLA